MLSSLAIGADRETLTANLFAGTLVMLDMHRRAFLRASTGTLASLTLGVAGATQSADGSAFGPLGSVEIPAARDAVVQGEFAYVAVDEGFVVVDISEPATPTIVAERRNIDTGTSETFRKVLDLWVSEGRLLVAGPGSYDPQLAHGFGLFDVGDPTSPTQLTFKSLDSPLSGGYFIHNVYLEDGVAYLTGSAAPSNPLVMFDVTGDQPREVGRWSLESYDSGYADVSPPSRSLHDVTVHDGIAYIPCWDAGTWIVDVSDPTAPRVLANITEYDVDDLTGWSDDNAVVESVKPPGNAHYTMVNEAGDLLGVGQEAWAFKRNGSQTGGPGGIDLYDVSTPSEPRHLSRIDAPDGPDQTRSGPFTSAHNFDFAGDVLYTSWYYGGVKVYNISDPTEPQELAWWQNSEETSFWTANGAGDTFVATSANISNILRENPPDVGEGLYVFPGLADGEPPGGEATVRNMEDTNSGTDQNNTTDEADQDSADAGGPGFGLPAAIAGLAGGGYLGGHLRSDSGDGEDRI